MITTDIDWSGYLDSPAKAAQDLGAMLHRGELALFVGAGISLDYGAPNWHSLARVMARATGIESAGINRKRASGANLVRTFSEIRDGLADSAAFDELVKKWLYYRWNQKKVKWASDTLVALGALMCGNQRGRVDTVLSTNFDSFLEMYLFLSERMRFWRAEGGE